MAHTKFKNGKTYATSYRGYSLKILSGEGLSLVTIVDHFGNTRKNIKVYNDIYGEFLMFGTKYHSKKEVL